MFKFTNPLFHCDEPANNSMAGLFAVLIFVSSAFIEWNNSYFFPLGNNPLIRIFIFPWTLFWFWGHTKWYSGLTSESGTRDYFLWGLGAHMGWWGLKLGWQVPYLLYFLSRSIRLLLFYKLSDVCVWERGSYWASFHVLLIMCMQVMCENFIYVYLKYMFRSFVHFFDLGWHLVILRHSSLMSVWWVCYWNYCTRNNY